MLLVLSWGILTHILSVYRPPSEEGGAAPSYGDDNTPLKTPNSLRRQPFEPCLKDAAGTGGEGGCSAMRTGAAALPLQRWWWLWAIGQSLCWLSSAGGANGCCASRALSCAALAPFSLEGEGQLMHLPVPQRCTRRCSRWYLPEIAGAARPPSSLRRGGRP